MTGGGPGGATRVYSILAYEKAIIGLRFGPGIATAFSMAPLLAVFNRPVRDAFYAERRGRTRPAQGGIFWSVCSAPWGAFFRPAARPRVLAARVAVETVFNALARAARRKPPPASSGRSASGWARGRAYCCCCPCSCSSSFPFTGFLLPRLRPTCKFQQFASIYWPRPWTFPANQRTCFLDTPFLTWFRNTVIVANRQPRAIFRRSVGARRLRAGAVLSFWARGTLTVLLLVHVFAAQRAPLYPALPDAGPSSASSNTYAALIVTYPDLFCCPLRPG